MSARAVLAALLIVLLAVALGAVSYLHWGNPAADSPEAGGPGAGPGENATAGDASGPPTWGAPTWREGERWTYHLWTPNGTGTVFLQVQDADARYQGAPAYQVYRSADNRTVHFHRDTINRIAPDGTPVEVYRWPLEDGATWNLTGPGGQGARVRAEFVHDIVTPLGLLDGYKLTADYRNSSLVEVYYYVDDHRSYVRVDNYRDGRLVLAMALASHGVYG